MEPSHSGLVFTPSLFYKYAKSPHWIWHDINTDPSRKGELSELAEKLIDQGQLHEEDVVAKLPCTEVTEDDIAKAVVQTRELMTSGAERIYQGALELVRDGVRHVGRPDLLEKRDGESRFGNYFYVPVDIKSTGALKKTHKHQLTLYVLMLEAEQGEFPATAEIINSAGERIAFEIRNKVIDDTLQTRDAILDIMRGNKPPLRLTSTYKQTPWFDVCLEEAVAAEDLALIYNLDHRSAVELRAHGISSIHDAAAMNVDALPKISYSGKARLKRAKKQAQSLVNDEVIWLAKPDIRHAPMRLYFDIEGDPLLSVEYLFGFWVVEDNKEPRFEYFLAETPDKESEMWQAFLSWIETLPVDYVVYHYADYERQRLQLLATRHGSSSRLAEFEGRLEDLAKTVQQSVILPLYFYSIKDIAKSKFLNFKWRHQQAGGAQSVFWYEKWLETGDRNVLQDIVDYNEDDVRATEFLHQWLVSKGRG